MKIYSDEVYQAVAAATPIALGHLTHRDGNYSKDVAEDMVWIMLDPCRETATHLIKTVEYGVEWDNKMIDYGFILSEDRKNPTFEEVNNLINEGFFEKFELI